MKLEEIANESHYYLVLLRFLFIVVGQLTHPHNKQSQTSPHRVTQKHTNLLVAIVVGFSGNTTITHFCAWSIPDGDDAEGNVWKTNLGNARFME